MTHRLQLAAALLVITLAANPPSQHAQSSPAAKTAKPATPAATISAAVCPVVYQLDDSPTRHGYHYIFYGNAFFINRDGYLLTAAHVLSEFRDGGQPSILLSRPYAPPRLVKVTVVATDVVHDVAILRATPNPFDAGYTVAALPLADGNLSDGRPAAGDPLAIQALRPAHAKDPETFELPVPESYSATMLTYRAINLDPAAINAHSSTPVLAAAQLTDIFLFNHEVIRGQSGAPVTSPSTHQVVGLIEGRWLHPASGSSAGGSAVPGRATGAPSRRTTAATTAASQKSVPPTTVAATGLNLTQGAAVPISYAKSLLQKNHIPGPPPRLCRGPRHAVPARDRGSTAIEFHFGNWEGAPPGGVLHKTYIPQVLTTIFL